MNTNDSQLLHKLFHTICSNNNIENLGEDLKIIFSDFYDISEINILYYDNKIKKLKNVVKDFEIIDDYYSKEKCELLNGIYLKLTDSKFVLNDDTSIPDDALERGNNLSMSLSLGLKYESETIGLIRFKFRNKTNISSEDLLFFEGFGYNLSLKVMNIVLSKQLETTSNFYKSMKDIAKIIENQYDFQYIIPLIGEMIDKFATNHLIYIFIKQNDKYNLFWPTACWNSKIYELLEKIKPENNVVISSDKKTGIFGLKSEGDIIGCIVAHSTIDKLTDEETEYLKELTKQSTKTIELANTYSEILQNATMDALTGLNNRRQFENRLKEQYSIANRQNTPLCAIMTDIDYFKSFNDTYGHAIGDAVLKTTAGIIKEQLRDYDIPSRYGGEEFCILLPQTGIDEAKIVADRLRSAVEKAEVTVKDDKKVNITISVGLAELDIKDMPEDLYMKADKALYDAKESGRNKVVIYSK